MKEVTIYKEEIPSDGIWVARLVMSAGFADTPSEAKQLISRGRILIDKKRVQSDALMRIFSEPISVEYIGREIVKVVISD